MPRLVFRLLTVKHLNVPNDLRDSGFPIPGRSFSAPKEADLETVESHALTRTAASKLNPLQDGWTLLLMLIEVIAGSAVFRIQMEIIKLS